MFGRVVAAVVLGYFAAAGLWWHSTAFLALAAVWGLAWLSVELDERSGRRIARRRR